MVMLVSTDRNTAIRLRSLGNHAAQRSGSAASCPLHPAVGRVRALSQLRPLEKLSVDRHDHGARRQQYRAHGRSEKDTPRGKHASGQGNGKDVVTGRPPEVLEHLPVGRAGQLDDLRDVARVGPYQHDVTGLHCDIGAGADRDIGGGQGRGIDFLAVLPRLLTCLRLGDASCLVVTVDGTEL